MHLTILQFILLYLGINLISFVTMFIDKKKAIKNSFRIPEQTLFFLGFILGAVGIYVGMLTFRHKTKKPAFKIFVPVLIIINIITIYYLYNLGIIV